MIVLIAILGMLIIIIGITTLKDIQNIKKIVKNDQLEKWVQKFPTNKEICEKMLKIVKNEKTKVKQSSNNKTNLYVISTNTILISSNDDNFTRIQTIAHECIHSIQNKTIQWFHFIYSIFWNAFYYVICIMQILGKIQNTNLTLNLLLIFSYIYYVVRNYLEMEAMLKAKEIACEYMKEENKISEEAQREIINTYENLNKIGVKTASYNLIEKELVKIFLYCIIIIAK